MNLLEQAVGVVILLAAHLGPKTHARTLNTLLDHVVQSDEGTTDNEKNVRGVEADEFLLRMLAAALGGDVGHGPFDDFQKRLLHALAGHVAG